MTGPAMPKILAPTPVTQPSALNSIAGLTTEFANPVMGTSVPAPALAASYCRSASPRVQMAPPTKNAHAQSRTTGDGGDARLTISSYCLGSSFTFHSSSFWG